MSQAGYRALLAVNQSGFELLGVVVGSAAYQLVRPAGCLRVSGSAVPVIYTEYERAQHEMWQLALGRLEAEATAAGAHGVIGVSVKQELVPGSLLTQLSLIGSAVGVPGAPPLERPFLSMLALNETLKLLLRGWVPAGVVCGIAAVHVCGWGTGVWSQSHSLSNTELVLASQGMQLARVRAEQQVRAALAERPMGGVVAPRIEITHSDQQCSAGAGKLIDCRIVGTVAAKYREPAVGVSGARNMAVRRTE
jgi:uncharacterized protein YbjQ (UPF0145 family)